MLMSAQDSQLNWIGADVASSWPPSGLPQWAQFVSLPQDICIGGQSEGRVPLGGKLI